MKKIKFFALAAFAMLSTNAFAQANLTEGAEQTIDGIRYEVTSVYKTTTATNLNTVKASMNGLTGTTITIPATITFHVKGKDNEATPVAIDEDVEFMVTAVGSFAGLSTATTLSVGANVETIDEGAFVGTKITSLDLSGTKVTDIERLFTNTTTAKTNSYLESVSLPASAETIKANAFDGCNKLATVTFADLLDNDTANPNDNVADIKAGAFAGTAIVTLDLTNTKIEDLNKLFEDMNTTLTTVITPATLKNIKTTAFQKVGKLATLTLTKSTKLETIEASAFDITPSLTTLTVPAGKLLAKALDGSSIKTLTYGAKIETAGTIAAIDAAKLETVTFNGDITIAGGIAENAFKASTKLATVNFKGQLTADGAIAEGAFTDAGKDNAGVKETINGTEYTIKMTVNYTPLTANKGKYPFDLKAFAAADPAADYIKFVTSTEYGEALTTATKIPNAVVLSFTPTSTDLTLEMANNGSGSYYYGIISQAEDYDNGTDYMIAAKQGTAKVMVYAGYTDYEDDGLHVYMQQLKVIGGYYHIPAGSNVVVKSTTADDVTIEVDVTGEDSHLEDVNGDINEILSSYDDAFATDVFATQVQALHPGMTVYFLMPFTVKNLTFQPWGEAVNVPLGWYYIEVDPALAARLTVTWLDGSEEDQTTAIQAVKSVDVENDAIYNLAGQKVSASYKGVVIKNGKKFIQK